MGFTLYCTDGTAHSLKAAGIHPTILQKIAAGARPNVLDLMHNGQIALIINTPTRTGWQTDEGRIRSTAVRLNIPMITTLTAATMAVRAIAALRKGDWSVAALQDYVSRAVPAPKPSPQREPALR
jgi:carbamoyl-phosphate synthase large subunit